MRTGLWIVLIPLLLGACQKRKNAEQRVEAVAVDLPLVAGRHIDSLRPMAYEARILAFSIELGHRSSDFNKRLGLIIGLMSADRPWREVVEQQVTAPNYRQAESYNRSYLDSLAGLLHDPPAALAGSRDELAGALQRLHANYEALRQYDRFSSMSVLLDSVLVNEQIINRSLSRFKTVIEAVQSRRSSEP